MMGLTPKLEETLSAIRSLSRGGVPPSLRELQDHLGLSSISQVHKRITSLRERGAVTFDRQRARSLQLSEDAKLLSLPTPQLRLLRDQIDRELRRRAW